MMKNDYFVVYLFVDVAGYIMNQRVCRLQCNDVQYYLLTTDKDGDIELLLTDTVGAWHGCGGPLCLCILIM